MSEINYLAFAGHRRQQTECLFRTKIVECLHYVVGKERRWSAGSGEFMIAGDPQRQVELKSRPLRQFGSDPRATVDSLRDQKLAAVRGLG